MQPYKKTINELIRNLPPKEIIGDDQKIITGLCIDSREVVPQSLFIAIVGEKVDGHDFIATAIEMGASAIVCEKIPDTIMSEVTYIRVPDTKEVAGSIADSFYDHPSHAMKVVGVTGTNGKTTIATALYNALTDLGYICGLVSTIENKIGKETRETERTTPDALSLQKLFADMRDAGCSHVFMEVSSHALVLGRVTGVKFTGAIFTNLTHDHLDFHKTMDVYAEAKKMLFDNLLPESFAISNHDDAYGAFMTSTTPASVSVYGLDEISEIEYTILGTHFIYKSKKFFTPLVGKFNLYNTLALISTLEQLGITDSVLEGVVNHLQAARGRFEVVSHDNRIGIIDYAHTPDALKNVLETITHLKKNHQKVITVVGAGGDRDASKRAPMASIACELSDYVILTSDNPRTENPEQILEDMESGVLDKNNYTRIQDRVMAIQKAKEISQEHDIILIAGKGHETYQDIMGVKSHFDDREEFLK